jgi:hypothetical protein
MNFSAARYCSGQFDAERPSDRRAAALVLPEAEHFGIDAVVPGLAPRSCGSSWRRLRRRSLHRNENAGGRCDN